VFAFYPIIGGILSNTLVCAKRVFLLTYLLLLSFGIINGVYILSVMIITVISGVTIISKKVKGVN